MIIMVYLVSMVYVSYGKHCSLRKWGIRAIKEIENVFAANSLSNEETKV